MHKPDAILQLIEQKLGMQLTQLVDIHQMMKNDNRQCYVLGEDGSLLGLNLANCDLKEEQVDWLLKSVATIQALNISGNSFTRLTLGNLHQHLTYLNISENKTLNHLHFEEALPKLSRLVAHQCNLDELELPEGFEHLTWADFSRNKALTSVALNGRFPHLQYLDLSHNRLTAFTTPLAGQLKLLYLNNNAITQFNIPQRLPNLQTLHLRNNQLENFNPLLMELLPGLAVFYLAGNPLLDYLSATIQEMKEGESCITFMRDMYQRVQVGTAENNEHKVLVIGNGGAGKTTLVKVLKGEKFQEKYESTEGIQLTEHQLGGYKLNIWDFAGQDIYHATHRLFMEQNAIFLVVWSKESEEKPNLVPSEDGSHEFENHSLSYWLDYARVLGKKSPSIVIQTHSGLRGINRMPRPDIEQRFKKEFDYLAFQAVESSIPKKTQNGFRQLEAELEVAIDTRKYNNREIPQQWADLRQIMRNKYQLGIKDLPMAEYLAIAAGSSINLNEESAMFCLNFLTKTGVVFYRKGLFKNKIILDQAWAIEAIYTLLHRGLFYFQTLRRKGHFNGQQLAEAFRKQNYTETSEHELFLSFMLTCKLCYETTIKEDRYPSFEERTFIAPQLLDPNKPDGLESPWRRLDTLHIRYDFEFLHEGIIQEFIIDTYANAETQNVWRRGIQLEHKGNQLAIIEANPKENYIDVRVTQNGKELLDIVRNLIEKPDSVPFVLSVKIKDWPFIPLKRLELLKNSKHQYIDHEGVYNIPLKPYLGTFLYKDERAAFESKDHINSDIPINFPYSTGKAYDNTVYQDEIVQEFYEGLKQKGLNIPKDKEEKFTTELKQSIQELISKGKVEEAFTKCLPLIENPTNKNSFFMIHFRYNDATQKFSSGFISLEEHSIKMNQIVKSFLNFIEAI